MFPNSSPSVWNAFIAVSYFKFQMKHEAEWIRYRASTMSSVEGGWGRPCRRSTGQTYLEEVQTLGLAVVVRSDDPVFPDEPHRPQLGHLLSRLGNPDGAHAKTHTKTTHTKSTSILQPLINIEPKRHQLTWQPCHVWLLLLSIVQQLSKVNGLNCKV